MDQEILSSHLKFISFLLIHGDNIEMLFLQSIFYLSLNIYITQLYLQRIFLIFPNILKIIWPNKIMI